MFRLSRKYQRSAEFLGRQADLFGAVLQEAAADLKQALKVAKRFWSLKWRSWFPHTGPAPCQLEFAFIINQGSSS